MAEGAVYTVGYGSRSFEELVALLGEHGIGCVVDVRTAPYSKFRPEFSKGSLEVTLPGRGIRYVFLGDCLGGRPDSPDCYEDGKVQYERVREKEFFRRGIEKLRRAREQGVRMALLCAEGKPEECHRSKLIGPALTAIDVPLEHLDEEGVLRSQDEVLCRITSGQLDLFGDPAFTSRKRYGGEP